MSPHELSSRGWDAPVPHGWKTPEQGAATSVWAAAATKLEGIGGRYLEDCAIATPWTQNDSPPSGHYLPRALDPVNADRLWTVSERLITDSGFPIQT
jgi:hypothetical protein